MKTIPLTRGQVASVDDEDYERVNAVKWYAQKNRNTWYAQRGSQTCRYDFMRMHHFILGIPSSVIVDHKDGDGLNNTRANLRISSRSLNGQNRHSSRNNTSGFRGVVRTPNGCWAAQIKHTQIGDKKRHYYLGRFDTAEDAARAYDLKARELFGEAAYQNFPADANQ